MQYMGKSVFFLMVILFFCSAASVGASPAQDQLKQTIDSIIAVLKNPEFKSETQKENRRVALKKIVAERFDFEKMSQLSLARHWKERTESEKSEFVVLFGRLLEDTYIAKVEAYTDETVVFLNERIEKKKAQIDTKVATKSVEIPINYRMYTRENGQWMVYDVVIEGVSLVGNYRSQFGQILEKDSFEVLMDKLKKK
ncbi:MAG: ABC transporter substrate-binding protein [Proteobacteria bacterium]|nr:ABC transporter substrate-binding protein [Pseudomonadota bacterium]